MSREEDEKLDDLKIKLNSTFIFTSECDVFCRTERK